jgi:GNAT superfamily N-acetyltransferase
MKQHIIDSIIKNFLFQIIYFASYVPEMKILNIDNTIKCTNIKDDTFNMVIDTHFTSEKANQKIKETIKVFQDKALPFSWWVGPSDTPSNLKELLISNGFSPKENDYGMYLDLKNFNPKPTNKLIIKQVESTGSLKEFDQVHVQSFGNPKAFDLIFSKIPSSAYAGKAPYRFFTGYVNNKAVTTGALVFNSDVVGVYFIVTLPEERRKGYATEMMNSLLSIAQKEKQPLAILQASADGKKVYEKMGFQECCIFQEFILKS